MKITEQLYQDFTEKMLPKINEGLVITKDYFMDLGGRYIKYLIVSDTLDLLIGLVFFITGAVIMRKVMKHMKDKWDNQISDEAAGMIITGFIISIVMMVISFFCILGDAKNVVKDIFIPEIRIIEEIRDYTNRPQVNNN